MTAIKVPHSKRVLTEASDAQQNAVAEPAPLSAKRRKLDLGVSASTRKPRIYDGRQKLPGSSNPKSQFEEEVLEKLSQDISQLKQKNSERDQQWDRPSLAGFDDRHSRLLFQQIEAEKGQFAGGRATIRLFGVTEVGAALLYLPHCLAHLIS